MARKILAIFLAAQLLRWRITLAMLAPRTCEEYLLSGPCEDRVCVRLVGSPWRHTRAFNHFSLCKHSDDDRFFFARADSSGAFQCTDLPLDCSNRRPLAGTPRLVMPPLSVPAESINSGRELSVAAQLEAALEKDGGSSGVHHRRALQSVSQLKNLVLMIRFSDHVNAALPPASDYDKVFNHIGPDDVVPTGSIRDVFQFNTHGKIVVDSVVTGWIDVPYSEAQAAGPASFNNGNGCVGTCSSGMVRQAIVAALDQVQAQGIVDFADFDLDDDGSVDIFTVIHSGHPAEAGGSKSPRRIWSHKWALPAVWTSSSGQRIYNYNINPGLWGRNGNKIGRIGVMAHEMCHFLGLPDLYDTDYSSQGIGTYGLMADSWGVDKSQYYPPSLSPWSKERLGLIEVENIQDDGLYTLEPVQTTPRVLRLGFSFNGVAESDYLLIEYRKSTGFDRLSPGGILVWHIDPRTPANTQESYPGSDWWPIRHYKVRLIQADGIFGLERDINSEPDIGDWFRDGGELSDLTNPSLNAYKYYGVRCSGHRLTQFSAPGDTMSFVYTRMAQDCSGRPVNDGTPTTSMPTSSPTSDNGWTCNDNYYNSGNGCDCECGIYDPDCDVDNGRPFCWESERSGLPVNGYTCDKASNTCIQDSATPAPSSSTPAPTPTALQGWTCPPSTFGLFDANNGCDCGCGILDPDCLKPLTGENDGVYCYSDSSLRERSDKACNAVTAECEEVSGGNNETTPSPTIAGWICPTKHYGTSDGCHCSCGIADPDCSNPSAQLFCGDTMYDSSEFYCDAANNCEPIAPNPTPQPSTGPPAGWSCAEEHYGNDDGCHCECGGADPDCSQGSNSNDTRLFCGSALYDSSAYMCSGENLCVKRLPASQVTRAPNSRENNLESDPAPIALAAGGTASLILAVFSMVLVLRNRRMEKKRRKAREAEREKVMLPPPI